MFPHRGHIPEELAQAGHTGVGTLAGQQETAASKILSRENLPAAAARHRGRHCQVVKGNILQICFFILNNNLLSSKICLGEECEVTTTTALCHSSCSCVQPCLIVIIIIII